jgi:hypothetical protein
VQREPAGQSPPFQLGAADPSRITPAGSRRRSAGSDDRGPLDTVQRSVAADQLECGRVLAFHPAEEIAGRAVGESGADHPPFADGGIGRSPAAGIRHG